MKKNLLWLAGTAVLVACAQTELEPVETKAPVKHEIKVDAYLQGQTRATDTTLETIQGTSGAAAGTGFQLAILKDDVHYGESPYNMSWSGSAWSFNATSTPTWPNEGTLDFYAWNNTSAFANPASSFTPATKTLSFTGNLNNFDFIVASSANVEYTPTTSLSFQHVMTKINVNVKAPNNGLLYYVKSIKMTGYETGDYIFGTGWTNQSASQSVDVFTATSALTYRKADNSTDETINSADFVSKIGTATAYFVPDPASGAMTHKLSIEYYVLSSLPDNVKGYLYSYLDEVPTGQTEEEISAAKTADISTSLKAGDVITLNVTLTSETREIVVETIVNSWNATPAGTETVTPA